MEYNLEIGKAINEINRLKAKKVLIQLADGLKPFATQIIDEIESSTKAKCFIWLGSCYGACDLPPVKDKDFDLLIQFGHSPWPFWK